ncbi:hypothetical protein EF096_01830 [Pseudomonas neustonica]|uniref:Zinc ribbon domain-containing protein n=1 Tax=Pseudomonas neustonica TaxID=2487346 RepID=A0ABX9XQT1_9PSED|nr:MULTISPECIES: hypothetical protein [Pseudomonas]ROZ86929.1 hypothetical protein EF099_00870 [Pseudomonas sp. SSM44]ROZ88455.1 hypothetical protein EF096_01830 [Pseudomonas neustonica]
MSMGDYFNFFYGVISALVVGFYIGYGIAAIRTRNTLMEELISARNEASKLRLLNRLLPPEEQLKGCGNCHKCYKGRPLWPSGPLVLDRMIVCPICGNKRCPKATDHELPCSGSNSLGQPGSIHQ